VLVGANKDSVETLSMLAYDEASNTRYGPASAYATILFLYVAVVAYAFVKLLGADVLGDRVQKKAKNGKNGKNGKKQDRDTSLDGAVTTSMAGSASGGGGVG
jgi:multiple sugar transport system permease protein